MLRRRPGAVNKLKKQILEVVFEYIPRDKYVIFIFGSLAQNEVYPSSDIDIGIVGEHPLANSTVVKLKEGLRTVETLRDIDVVDFLVCSG